MATSGSGASAMSRQGQANEDAYLAHDGLGLYLVCDGASEGPYGEVAATTAIAAVESFVEEAHRRGEGALRALVDRGESMHAVRHAMKAVVAASEHDDSTHGMVTTISLVLVHRHHAAVCHVGDSRVYLVRAGHLHQLTSDSELTLTSAGETSTLYEDVPLESFSIRLEAEDTLVLCTDGAEEVVENSSAHGISFRAAPAMVAQQIVDAAARSHPDRDATAVVVRVLPEEAPGWLLLSHQVRAVSFGHTLQPT